MVVIWSQQTKLALSIELKPIKSACIVFKEVIFAQPLTIFPDTDWCCEQPQLLVNTSATIYVVSLQTILSKSLNSPIDRL
jgi:hypothetical protein